MLCSLMGAFYAIKRWRGPCYLVEGDRWACYFCAIKDLARDRAPTLLLPVSGTPWGRSVYQYFPNKVAILFRLQADEWRETTEMLRNILEDVSKSPLARLRALIHIFLRSECEEARMRVALKDAAPLYRDAPEVQQVRASGERTIELFMEELLPKVFVATRVLAGDLITTTFSAVGRK